MKASGLQSLTIGPYRGLPRSGGESLRLIPEVRVPFDHLGSRVANTGASFATGVAYLLFALMFLTMVSEVFLLIVRAYF